MEQLLQWTPWIGGAGLIVAFLLYSSIKRLPEGNERMQDIARQIHVGAMAFLRREYIVLGAFVVIVALLLGYSLGQETAMAYVSGALCSIAAGFFGMQAATKANVRTAEAARSHNQGKALLTAFDGGAVMGVSVASLGLIGVGIFFLLFGDPAHASIINGFAMGASSIALFARVGGGIYTKAADVGADLVGKVEAGIPEDDPRNPGVIADNVGDNVGDVAGMGADIFESYVGAIIATIAIGATLLPEGLTILKAMSDVPDESIKSILMALPLVLAGIGLLASFIGIGSMRVLKQFSPAGALRYSTFIAAAVFLGG
ncbi:MAG: sodium/proton-translocating pyrophosphatase, partial [Bacteroidota bacterium]